MSFEHRFELVEVSRAMFHVFADTRYRLWVNEKFVSCGPARFVTPSPEYDSHELTGFLREGANLVRVEVNFYGSSSFQTMPDGRPGFICDGGIAGTGVSFATPGRWKARIHRAWDAQAPSFSFAQNPAEICDTRVLAAELAVPAACPLSPLPEASTPWLTLLPRSVPLLDYAIVRPSRILVARALEEVIRWGIQSTAPRCLEVEDGGAKSSTLFNTWIHSPLPQFVKLDCFWGNLALNGEPLEIDYTAPFGNHGQCSIRLREGWNFLSVSYTTYLQHWSYLLGLPREAGASLHAVPDRSCTAAFACSPPTFDEILTPCPDEPSEYVIPAGWSLINGQLENITPARLIAWDRPVACEGAGPMPFSGLPRVSSVTAKSAVWCFDFQDEFYGHPVIEVEAPAGSVLDIAYDDWRRADGCVNLYGSNPFVDAADRFILRGGRQRIEVLNPRGGIYLQVILRAPLDSPPVSLQLHDVHVRRRTLLNINHGTFHCGDPILDWAWQVSIHTLQASTDEAYADCPWRERASYIGDSLVNFHIHRVMSADLSVARRTFASFGKAQLANGQLACCAPSWLTKPHEDFTLIWIQAVRDFWAYTGDTDFIAEQWPVIQRIWESSAWKAGAGGLWDTSGMRVFADWGVLKSEREGEGNLIINILRIAAARASAEMAGALGRSDEAARFLEDAERISSSVCAHLWNEGESRFDASIGATTAALHGNILALRYGVGPADRILAYLEPKLRDNFQRGIDLGEMNGFAELYFFHYLLPALADHGRAALAEDLIREHYGYIRSLDYPTLPECFHNAGVSGGSCCHSWSGAPGIYAVESILGFRLAHPGNPDVWRLDPKGARPQAEGTLPHPRGLIHVQWESSGDRIKAWVAAPEGIIILPAEHVDLITHRIP